MNKSGIFGIIIALILGVVGGYWYAAEQVKKETTAVTMEKKEGRPEAKERKILFYRNAMNPAVTSPVPAKDAMGMDYVTVYADEISGGGKSGTVVIDPKVIQTIGVRTTVVTRKDISRNIQTTGRVAYDEDFLFRLHPKISGWIEKLFVSETGTVVKPGTRLLSIYSPEQVSSQQEYLLAIRNAEILADSPFADIRQGAQGLLQSSRERLELMDVPEHQILALEKTQKVMKALHIHSPAKGIVLKIGVREGQHVTAETELYKIADLTRIWAYVDVYEYELPWVRLRDKAEMRLESYPGRVFKGNITYIYPYLDPKTRTNKMRLEFENADLALKPDMFANVTLYTSRKLNALVIPSEAIIRTGKIPKVFVQVSHGSFEPRHVKLGLETDDETEILSGVEEGERVVISSQFLLDSESSLIEAATKMIAPDESPKGPHEGADMKGMDMGREEK